MKWTKSDAVHLLSQKEVSKCIGVILSPHNLLIRTVDPTGGYNPSDYFYSDSDLPMPDFRACVTINPIPEP